MNNNETDRSNVSPVGVQNAREMTAEIDRITEEEVHKLESQNAQVVERGQAGVLGGRVLTSAPNVSSDQSVVTSPNLTDAAKSFLNGEATGSVFPSQPIEQIDVIRQENQVIQSNNLVRSEAERAEGYTQATASEVSLVGAETNVQAQEWLAEDREDIENESGLNGRYVKHIMDKNNKHITSETVAAVEKMIAQNEYHPSKLDRMANQARTEFLKNVFNRILGSRN